MGDAVAVVARQRGSQAQKRHAEHAEVPLVEDGHAAVSYPVCKAQGLGGVVEQSNLCCLST